MSCTESQNNIRKTPRYQFTGLYQNNSIQDASKEATTNHKAELNKLWAFHISITGFWVEKAQTQCFLDMPHFPFPFKPSIIMFSSSGIYFKHFLVKFALCTILVCTQLSMLPKPTGTSILEAIRESVGVETEVEYEECPTESAIETGKFSYAVVVVGEVPYAESSGDRTDLSIPFNGSDLITRVASKVPTLVIVISGRPLEIEPQVLEKVEALVAAWLPGSEGMGIADCLFGDYDFVGTLPVTWFRSVDQLPMNVGGSNYDPLFPLGYGLKCSQVMDI
jgi:hypothetical protein